MHTQSCPNLLQPHGLEFTRPLHPRDFPGKNTGVGCHFFLQGIFPTQVSNLCLISPALAGRFLTTVPAGKHINKLKPAPNALGHRRNNTQLRKWQPTAVFLPGKSHGQRNLAAYSPWSPKESGWIEQLTHTVWGKQQKYHRHNRFEFDTINDKEDTLLGSPAGTDAQWHPNQWYIQGRALSWDGDRAGYVEEGWGLQQLKLKSQDWAQTKIKDYNTDGNLLKMNLVKKILWLSLSDGKCR